MALNPFINSWTQSNDQTLVEDLMIEAIKNYGFDCQYLPRTLVKEDMLFGEDVLSKFSSAVTVEMYLKDVQGFNGDGDFLSKFGMEVRDQVTLLVSKRRFANTVGSATSQTRPLEGDLIWLGAPFNHMWEIRGVEHERPMYQIGNLICYELTCDLFKYSHERIQTGNTTIDAVQSNAAYTLDLVLGAGSGTYTNNEIVYQGSYPNAMTATGNVVSWTANTSTLRVTNLSGSFEDATAIKGVSSGASYVLASVNDSDFVNDLIADNDRLQDQGDAILDWSETNPFSDFQEGD